MQRAWSRGALTLGFLVLSGFGSISRSEVPDSAAEVHPLMIGSEAPAAQVHDAGGKPVELADLIRKQPTILIFYRGGW